VKKQTSSRYGHNAVGGSETSKNKLWFSHCWYLLVAQFGDDASTIGILGTKL
jgi:hypothetical protein